jgi:SAM-dependent methyltransferase
MSEADRQKWERRYAERDYKARTHPTLLLVEWLARLPRGRALDLASGTGRNALYLAAEGYQVDAMDIAEAALERGRCDAAERGLEVNWMAVDLDDAALPAHRYDLIVIARYLNRGLTDGIMAALADGGHLLYEQHFHTEQPVDGPTSRGFRLEPNELLRLFAPLRTRFYREEIMQDADGRSMALAQLVACKGSPGY